MGEAMTLEQALAYLKPDDANNGTISLQAPKAREAVEVIEAVLGGDNFMALVRENLARQGTKSMRDASAAFDHQAALADCRDFDSGYRAGVEAALKAAGLWDAALPLQPEGERNA